VAPPVRPYAAERETVWTAAPWLLGGTAPKRQVPPEELFEKLTPFKDLFEHDSEDERSTGSEPVGDPRV
jgi:hypothetical protein